MFRFVLKETGWWLKIQNVDELLDYYNQIDKTRFKHVLENYIYGKEWNDYHEEMQNKEHARHWKEAALTDAVVRFGSHHDYNIIESISNFSKMIIEQQLDMLEKTGCIYINRNGGYHGKTTKPAKGFIYREKLMFPEYQKEDIRILQFPNGKHYYAYIDDLEVREGDNIKWNTYEEAYQKALSHLTSKSIKEREK